MPGAFQRSEFAVMGRVVFALGPDIDEEAIVAIKRGIAEWFAFDRNQAPAVLAGRLGDQLLGPGAETGNSG